MAPELLAQLDIDAGGRLVEHQDRRLVHHRLGHHQPPPHAARQRARRRVGLVGEAEHLEQAVGAPLGGRHAVEPGLQLQQLARGEEEVDDDLLRHHADGGARLARRAVDVDAPDRRRCPRS